MTIGLPAGSGRPSDGVTEEGPPERRQTVGVSVQVTSLAGQGDLDRECRVERATRRELQPWVAVPASHLPGRKAGYQGLPNDPTQPEGMEATGAVCTDQHPVKGWQQPVQARTDPRAPWPAYRGSAWPSSAAGSAGSPPSRPTPGPVSGRTGGCYDTGRGKLSGGARAGNETAS